MSPVCIVVIKSRGSTDSLAGTSFVYDDVSRPGENAQLDSYVKYDRTGHVPIILVPQPSDDPNDPLVSRFLEQTWWSLIECRIGHYGSAT